MHIVGLTGSFGSGKTTVAKMLKAYGGRVVDADKIVHQLMSPQGECFQEVIHAFGPDIVVRGKIDRKKLAKIVFSSPYQLKKLTRIVHPVVIEKIKGEIKKYRTNPQRGVLVIDAPLLIETGLHRLVDILIVVRANHQKQILRIQKERKLSRGEILQRIRRQMSIRQKMKFADIIIDNRYDKKDTQKQVREIWKKIQKRR